MADLIQFLGERPEADGTERALCDGACRAGFRDLSDRAGSVARL